jgi:hypothetical protein
MKQDLKGYTGLRNPEEMAGQHKVAGAGNRKKFGEPLDDTEQNRVEQCQCASRIEDMLSDSVEKKNDRYKGIITKKAPEESLFLEITDV